MNIVVKQSHYAGRYCPKLFLSPYVVGILLFRRRPFQKLFFLKTPKIDEDNGINVTLTRCSELSDT